MLQDSLKQKILKYRQENGIESTFNDLMTEDMFEELTKTDQLLALTNWSWGKSLDDTNFIKLFLFIDQATCEDLSFLAEYNSRIIERIQVPKFVNLRELNLSRNMITCIQNLAFLNMDKLLTLNLCQNSVTNFKSLSKTNWTQLRTLYLDLNNCTEWKLSRVRGDKEFQALTLVDRYDFLEYNNDLSPLFKVEFTIMDHLNVSNEKRILMRKVGKKLYMRNPQARITFF